MGESGGKDTVNSVTLSSAQKSYLVMTARRSVEVAVIEGRAPKPDELPARKDGSDGFLKSNRGVFVTLTDRRGGLRGCIGLPYPVRPLGEAIIHAAVGAATRDPRFPRVESSELASLTVEVSALTPPEKIECEAAERPSQVRVGTDGLIVSGDGSSGLLLPQVATEMGLSSEAFLALTCEKAGLPSDSWRRSEVEVQRFQAEVFGEEANRGVVSGLETRS